MPIESSTVTTCSPVTWVSRSVRPRQGRISASRPATACERLSLVETCTVRSRPRIASSVRVVSGVAETKLPPTAKNALHLAVVHRAERVDRVEPVLAVRLEAELVAQPVEQRVVGLLPDPHRAVALHVGVAADRAQPGAALADVAAQEHQVGDLLDGRHRALVLGQAHRPADDDAVGLAVALGDPLDLVAGQPGGGEYLVPVELVEVGEVLVVLRGVRRRRTPRRPPPPRRSASPSPRTAPGRRRAAPGGSRR